MFVVLHNTSSFRDCKVFRTKHVGKAFKQMAKPLGTKQTSPFNQMIHDHGLRCSIFEQMIQTQDWNYGGIAQHVCVPELQSFGKVLRDPHILSPHTLGLQKWRTELKTALQALKRCAMHSPASKEAEAAPQGPGGARGQGPPFFRSHRPTSCPAGRRQPP